MDPKPHARKRAPSSYGEPGPTSPVRRLLHKSSSLFKRSELHDMDFSCVGLDEDLDSELSPLPEYKQSVPHSPPLYTFPDGYAFPDRKSTVEPPAEACYPEPKRHSDSSLASFSSKGNTSPTSSKMSFMSHLDWRESMADHRTRPLPALPPSTPKAVRRMRSSSIGLAFSPTNLSFTQSRAPSSQPSTPPPVPQLPAEYQREAQA